MDEITDFSLEVVQPIQETISNDEPSKGNCTSIGIEELLEFKMEDVSDVRKSKKHKKHKKSKKAAITLDEFLSMNKDVFGEGIDFQGVEEVPTQVVAKRLKPRKVMPTTNLMSSNLARLKKQGIVVKKQSNKAEKQMLAKKKPTNTVVSNPDGIKSQTKPSVLTSTDDVLSKLLNQGSQIKIVKKLNQDEYVEQEQDNTRDEKTTNNIPKKNEVNHDFDKITEAKDKHSEESEDKTDATLSKLKDKNQKVLADLTPLENVPVAGSNKIKDFKNSVEDDSDNNEHIDALHDPSLIAIKSTQPGVNNNLKIDTDNHDNGVTKTQIKDCIQQEERINTVTSEKSSLNALKHLSHLITIKPVNTAQTLALPASNKPESESQRVESIKALPPSTSPKTSEANHLAAFKNLSSITIKSKTQSNNLSKNNQLEEATEQHKEDYENEDECKKEKNTPITDKMAHILKSSELKVHTKHLPRTTQKESPTTTHINDNSQSSTDLLKHLKNLTAKPVNTSSKNVPTPMSSPNPTKKSTIDRTSVQQEVTEDGIEIFNIDDSDSDDANINNTVNHMQIKTENKTETNKPVSVSKNVNINISSKSNKTPNKPVIKESFQNKNHEYEDDDWSDDNDEKETSINSQNTKFMTPKPNNKNASISKVLKNLSQNITIKSRNSSPVNQFTHSHDHNSKELHSKTNEEDSDPDSPLSRVQITEMDNSEDELPDDSAECTPQLVKVQHPDDSHSDHDDEPGYEDFDAMLDIESHIEASKVRKNKTTPNTILNKNEDIISTSSNSNVTLISKANNNSCEEIPPFAKNLSNQISIKQIKKPVNNRNTKVVEQSAAHSTNQTVASSSNQLNTFNKEVKTVKTFQTQTKTVIQEITTTVTKTIKTVNQTKQEVQHVAQSNPGPRIPQKIQGTNTVFSQRNFQGVKVRQAAPNIRPKIRGQAPQTIRPAICAPPQAVRPANCAPIRATNQIAPVRPRMNRPSGPRPRMPNANPVNVRASTSGQQKPQVGRPVKVSPAAVFSSPKKPTESTGHFSCFKKPRESLIPVPDISPVNKSDGESSVQFSSTMQMSKSNYSTTTMTVKGNSVVTSQMKTETSASSQQLSKLRNMSGLSVVKTSQAKQSHVEEKSEMSASKRNALEAIQKLQNQGLLVKKPRLDVSEDSDHSQPGSDDMEQDFNDDFDE